MKKLLIVDDQQLYLHSLRVALAQSFDVFTACDYQGAIQKVDQGIDVVLVDIRLSETDSLNVDGLRILEWLRSNHPEVAVFVMSAFREFSYAEEALNLGARHFFRKPIDSRSLKAILLEKC